MACAQFPMFNDKAALEKYMNEFMEKTSCGDDKGSVEDGQMSTTLAFLVNHNKINGKDIYVGTRYYWNGSADPEYPLPSVLKCQPTDGPIEATMFKHHGAFPIGSVGAILFTDGSYKWLIAFDRVKYKIYVEAGAYGPVDWNVVKVKLDNSGSKSEFVDPITGAKAVAYYSGMGTYDNLYSYFY